MKCVIVDTSRSPYAKLKPVPVNSIKLNDVFWRPRIETLRKVTLLAVYEQLEKTGRIENFRRVARGDKNIEWRIADDSDVYKWFEALSYTLAYEHDDKLREIADSVAKDIVSAQDKDGYLFTYYAFNKEARWKDLTRMHELYCAGHFFQAAVAYYRATGSKLMLNAAIRLADHIASIFGPGKRKGVPGHPEIEMALVELYRVTGSKKYLDLAKFFIDERGKGLVGGSVYLIDHKPFRELDEIVGHAVRSLYLNCGATDVYMETGEDSLFKTLLRLWRSMVEKRMYVTGGVGSRHEGEAFGEDYELPDARAYCETCAAIANIMWNWRMLMATAEAKYADVMELALYNAALSGISLDGKYFFYVNPLADRGKHRREEWFGCACCPTNIVRLLAYLPGYFYSTSSKGIWVHLYAENSAKIELEGNTIEVNQYTKYPWEGEIEIEVGPEKEKEFSICLRIPGWCSEAEVFLNGRLLEVKPEPSTYLEIRKVWRKGDRIKLEFSMPVVLVASHPWVLNHACRVAIKRGPIVYCLEQADNKDFDVWDLVLPRNPELKTEFNPVLLGGVVVIKGRGYVADNSEWENKLYKKVSELKYLLKEVEFTAIPYYAWANREPGPMIVWVKYPLLPKNI